MAGPQPDLVDAMQGWLKRHKVFDTLAQVRDKMEALEAQRVASPEWKKFRVEYDRKMPLMMSALDMAPATKEVQALHDNLSQVLFHGRNTGGDDLALQAARAMDYATANKRMATAWTFAKELQREQAAISTEPGFAATLGKTLENSLIDRGELMKVLEYAIAAAKAFSSGVERAKLLNKVCVDFKLTVPHVPEEVMGLIEMGQDVYNGSKAITFLGQFSAVTAEVPIGPAAAAILSMGIVIGICLEMISALMDFLNWASKQAKTEGGEALKNVVSSAKALADVLEVVMKHAKPLMEFGKVIRKFAHKT